MALTAGVRGRIDDAIRDRSRVEVQGNSLGITLNDRHVALRRSNGQLTQIGQYDQP